MKFLKNTIFALFIAGSLAKYPDTIREAPIEKMFNKTWWNNWAELPVSQASTWTTKDRMIHYEGKPFVVRGANFNGFETEFCRLPLGLSTKPLSFFLDFLRSEGFNAIRLPLSYEIMEDLSLPIGTGCSDAESQIKSGMPVGDAIKLFMDESWKRGIAVLFDLHTIDNVITPMPWTDKVNENMVVRAWLNILERFAVHPALMGIEIKNEPHETITLEMFLTHCAKVIHNIEISVPDFKGLYFISGIQDGGAWGGSFTHDTLSNDFKGLAHPNILCTISTHSSQIVLNPHVYGTSVRGDDISYEGPKEWESRYGFITDLPNHWNYTTVLPTEIGGFLTASDKVYYYRWLDWHVHQKGFRAGGFWWTLAPFSHDTGGIFNDDYSVNWEKVDFMKLLAPDSRFLKQRLRRNA